MASIQSPFAHRVPTEVKANLHYRARIHRRVMEDPSYADVLWNACSIDPIFYVNAFGWTYDPRRQPFPRVPFILYEEFQWEVMLEIVNAIQDGHDLLIMKSRDMGASWMCCIGPEWFWHFRPDLSFLLLSRVEEYVDKRDNPKALFWKIDFFHDHLPRWLMPPGYDRNMHRSMMHMLNPHTRSVIDGESTNKRAGRGDRRTAILHDEFAAVEQGHSVLRATRDATRCRLFNSTPEGTGNAYYDLTLTNIKKLSLHWSKHPEKNRGLYTTAEDGTLRVLIEDGYPEGYLPILDGKLRSSWYDNECKRAASEREIAQELDIDFLGSGYQYFSAEAVRAKIREYARPPSIIGDLSYDTTTAEPLEFREEPAGKVKLWFLLGRDGKPPLDHKYVLGVDVSAGTGSSNSTICGYDAVTNEKALEFASPYIRPEELAKLAVAISRWLGGAYLVWESNGPGRQFGSRVLELRYHNIYYRKREESLAKEITKVPGWASTKETKLVLMGEYRSAVEKGDCINRSKEAMEECLEYIFDATGGVSHSRENSKDDPSGAKANHGDRVIADALAWRGLSERQKKPDQPPKPEVPYGSLAWRLKQRELEKPKPGRELLKKDGWY